MPSKYLIFVERANQVDVYELGEAIIKESGISAEIFNGGKDADNIARQENLEEFLSGVSCNIYLFDIK